MNTIIHGLLALAKLDRIIITHVFALSFCLLVWRFARAAEQDRLFRNNSGKLPQRGVGGRYRHCFELGRVGPGCHLME